MNLTQSIQDLLHEHECVILPNFGGFITNYKAAFIHPKKQMVYPPSKQISFNVNLKNNDGLLANFISQTENVSYQAALNFVNSSIQEFSEKLNSTQRLSIEGIGVLSMNSSGSVEFSPENSQNFLRDSFGLNAVFLPSLAELTQEELIEVEMPEPVKVPVIPIEEANTPHADQTTYKRSNKKSVRRLIAAAVFLPLMYFGGVTVHSNQSEISSFFAGFMPASDGQKMAVYTPRIDGEMIQFSYDEPKNELKDISEQNPELQSVFFSFDKGEISPDGLKVILNSSGSPAISSSKSSGSSSSLELYFIVAGCFKDETNANGLVNKLRKKGYDAGIFGKKGNLHMVCYGSYTNRSAAKFALSELQETENPGAWIKKH